MAIVVGDRTLAGGGQVRTLTLARPERRNALDPDHLLQLADAFDAASEAPDVRVLVVAGEGRAFCAGYDLSEAFPDVAHAPDEIVVRTMSTVREAPLPTIARIHGAAFGAGLELAISCDLRIAAEEATFCLPPARLGIAYAPEGLARLVSLVGTSQARRIAFAAPVVDARTALAIGLVDEVCPAAELDARVEALANTLAGHAPLALRAMKKTFNRLESRLPPEARAEAELERVACYRSEDAAEGLAAFTEKRPPRFLGR